MAIDHSNSSWWGIWTFVYKNTTSLNRFLDFVLLQVDTTITDSPLEKYTLTMTSVDSFYLPEDNQSYKSKDLFQNAKAFFEELLPLYDVTYITKTKKLGVQQGGW